MGLGGVGEGSERWKGAGVPIHAVRRSLAAPRARVEFLDANVPLRMLLPTTKRSPTVLAMHPTRSYGAPLTPQGSINPQHPQAQALTPLFPHTYPLVNKPCPGLSHGHKLDPSPSHFSPRALGAPRGALAPLFCTPGSDALLWPFRPQHRCPRRCTAPGTRTSRS